VDKPTEPAIPAPARPRSSPGASDDPLIGREVDHYRILGQLGGGGMGVVYKAEDTRLQRTVALKLLPPALTRDPVAKSRFLQEARAASALDHPNVCTVYDVGEIEEDRLYLAMPAYDGETVQRKIERGPLTVEQAVDVARQVASGLAKAHRQGIVHRDVKPANLMVTGDGIVKILDFGLAKLAGAMGLTRSGLRVGTPTYMSPEQAQGEVDHRTDLWSLGVVLYEMLAGRPPFEAESDPGIVHAVLHEEPVPLRRLRPDAPVELERIVARLLEKRLADRYPSAEAVLADLRDLGEPQPPTTGRPHTPPPRKGWWIVLAVLGVLAVLFVLWRARADRAPAIEGPVTQLTWQEGSERQPALSPDGTFLVYVKQSGGDSDLFWELVAGDNPLNLTADSPGDDSEPAVSPDGRQIAFRSERDGGGIFLMGATGESVRRLTGYGYSPAWSPDGREVAVATAGFTDPALRVGSSEIWVVPADGGADRRLVEADAVQPSWSPHGGRIAYWSFSQATGQRSLWTVRADGSGPVQVLAGPDLVWNPAWSPDGRYLWFLSDRGGSRNLWRVRIDESSGEPEGEAEPMRAPSEALASLSLGRDRLVYATLDSHANVERVAYDPVRGAVAGALAPVTRGSWSIRAIAVSPDGRWIAFHTQAPQEDLFVLRSDGGERRQLTNDVHKDRVPRWSPDGSSILFYSNRSGKYEAWRIRPDGGGLEALTRLARPVYSPIWSPDGRRLFISHGFEGATVDLGPPIERRRPVPLAVPGFVADAWSPDGRWLAGYTTEPGIHLYSPADRRLSRLTDRGLNATWLHDSRALLYLDQGRLHRVDLASRESQELIAPAEGSQLSWVAVGPDDRALFLVRQEDEGDVWMLTLR
jgi:serine/threonine protein kinase/WD40 repeat protein